jgi:PAS domain S-box-containing protein
MSVSHVPVSHTGPQLDGLEVSLREMCLATMSSGGAIVIPNETNHSRIIAQWSEAPTGGDGRSLPMSSGPCDEARSNHSVVFCNGAHGEETTAWTQSLGASDTATLIFVPLTHNFGVAVFWTANSGDLDKAALAVFERSQEVLDAILLEIGRRNELEQEVSEYKKIKASLEQAHAERQIAEDAIRASELKYRTLVEASPYCIKLIDCNGRLLSMNRAGLNMLGEKDEQGIVGRHYMQAVCMEDYDRIKPCLDRSLAGEYTEFEFQAAAGPYFRANLVPILDSHGKVHRLLGVTEDITQRKKDEKARIQWEERLRQSQKMEVVGQLAGGVAHDFNNFLTVILGHAELLLNSMKPTDAVVEDNILAVAQIHEAGSRAAAVTKQLLSFSRKDISNPGLIDIVAVVSGMQNLLQGLIGERYALTLKVAHEPLMVMADRGELDQVVLNLVNNAADAMPDGGSISLVVDRMVVESDAAIGGPNVESGTYATVTVRDQGHGIAQEHLSRIFEPFYTTKPRGKGTGLGLSTVYGVVEHFNGDIDVETVVDQGTAFIVYLPLASEAAQNAHEQGHPQELAHSTKRVVLVCEDDELVRVVTCNALRAHGYTVLEAESGTVAMDRINEHGGEIDLLVTDVVMPNMTGPQVATALREKLPKMRVLFVSGYASELLDVQGLLSSSVSFLQKPFGPQALVDRVRTVLV